MQLNDFAPYFGGTVTLLVAIFSVYAAMARKLTENSGHVSSLGRSLDAIRESLNEVRRDVSEIKNDVGRHSQQIAAIETRVDILATEVDNIRHGHV